ncbi:MAG: DEAD/DEAH box helicase family protein [Proteobacteria bacterium]|nr:DEAD/DEAH box helicase family protein [Planctomycetota bacterium]MBU4413339.1 DEAD/DEAH box helicase family protein [Pseudomonadota bacterium]MCG2822646.1 DEAD/DEAH box helicase family protein [Desulfobulbaceae bacterium]
MFKLKDYQEKALVALDGFFRQVRMAGLAEAWRSCAPVKERLGQTRQAPYSDEALGEVPAVCVRIPTGGGKTFLAAHAVARIGKSFCNTDAPLALWLVPSDAIRSQTLISLATPRHPCREALTEYFGERVRVCALDDLATVGPQDVGQSAIVVVATIQSFNVKEKSQRNVYSFDEHFARHFQRLTPQQEAGLDRVSEADIVAQPYLTDADLGRVKASLANWLALNQPIVIVDEAHNNRTEQAFRTLKNLFPACVVELTATPASGSNVLYHVGAQALQNEDMIKLPIVLMEHPTGWKDAVRDAILTRDRLENLAAQEPEYIRPVLLFQAEPINGEVTVKKLLEHLISQDGEKLDRKQIAVATGDQKELDGVVLADPLCPIRFVITVEALKEGWDCPFAYVLCSLQDAKSAKDVEQLLGRVLRMPYARPRQQAELGKAYAHIVAQGFAQVADQLADRLVNNMGFEAYEAAMAIVPIQKVFPLFGLDGHVSPKVAEAVLSLDAAPSLPVPEELKDTVEIRPTSAGATVIVRGELSEKVEDFLLASCPGKHQPKVKEAIDKARVRQDALLAPSARGERFAPLPQLCLNWDGELQPVEKRLLSELGEFDLFAEPINLAGFSIREQGATFEIDVEGGKVVLEETDSRQLHLNEIVAHATENDLVRWLDRECRQMDVGQSTLIKWLLVLVRHLMADRGLTLTALLRAKYQLAEAIRREIERRRQNAVKTGFQKSLPGFLAAPRLEDSFRYAFSFLPTHYPARHPYYSGRYRFRKHYYPVIHDLREKRADGTPAEEFACARAIDAHPAVKHWVRNVEKESRFSFWLPTADDYFYPDFVCELTDGRVLVVEYKGEPYKTNDDSREKAQIGHQWQESSEKRCLFLFAVKEDGQGRRVEQQLDHIIQQNQAL